jgi:predicted CoA-substrate-specific enzyme activase
MIVAGCDFGTLAIKVVLIKDGAIISSDISDTKGVPEQVAKNALDRALNAVGLSSSDVKYSVSTGWGRKRVPFANTEMGDLPCLAKGAQWLLPSARTVIDVGGQNSRALSINETGRIIEYNLNDKCAAGTGRFFELVADALELRLEDLAPLAYKSKEPSKISSQCCVFAESEIVTLINEGRELVDIVAGVHNSVVRRTAAIVGSISIKEDVVMSGGCAKNGRIVEGLGNMLNLKIRSLSVDPRLVGAIGAALTAQEQSQR